MSSPPSRHSTSPPGEQRRRRPSHQSEHEAVADRVPPAPVLVEGQGGHSQVEEPITGAGEASTSATESPRGDEEGQPSVEEPAPPREDDGWECQWDANSQSWFFHNRFTGVSQWQNPRVPDDAAAESSATEASEARPPVGEKLPAGGYNPAIHGDYDPNAWYAQAYDDGEAGQRDLLAAVPLDPSAVYDATAGFGRYGGQTQAAEAGPGRHSDEAKSRRQMNAYFDVDAAANAHDGRSLKAERANKRISKAELKAFKEKRRAKKEEKRRAWLMD